MLQRLVSPSRKVGLVCGPLQRRVQGPAESGFLRARKQSASVDRAGRDTRARAADASASRDLLDLYLLPRPTCTPERHLQSAFIILAVSAAASQPPAPLGHYVPRVLLRLSSAGDKMRHTARGLTCIAIYVAMTARHCATRLDCGAATATRPAPPRVATLQSPQGESCRKVSEAA